MIDTSKIIEPHKNHPVFERGIPIDNAEAVMIMIHGRGATAESILILADEFAKDKFKYIAPQASNNTWYPYRFIDPVEVNEPDLTSALQMISTLIEHVEDKGIPESKIYLLGFSQGACLALEYAARNPGNYGGIIGLSGGLIGPPGTGFEYKGSFTKETKVFLGCSDTDFHIPVERVHESAEVFETMGAEVTKEIYENMGHTVNNDEIRQIKKIINAT